MAATAATAAAGQGAQSDPEQIRRVIALGLAVGVANAGQNETANIRRQIRG